MGKSISMNGQTILMIVPFPPLPDSGGGIAIFGDLYELKQRGVAVDLICFSSDRARESIQYLDTVCRHFVLVEGPPPWSPGTMLDALLRRRPMVVARHKTSNMKLAINKKLTTVSYDVVLVEFAFMFQYFMESGLVSAGKRPFLVVDHHVVTPKVYEYFSRVERSLALELFRHFEIPRLKRYLRQVLVAGDKHLFLGQEDLDYIRAQIPGFTEDNKLVYRPAGLLLDRYPIANPDLAESYTLGFLGSFDWEANVDAVTYFVEEILPLIRLELPQVKLVLAGRAAPRQIRDLGEYPSIEFLGEVEDMFNVAQRVAVVVVPLRIGAGTRLKILEAMAWGKPIVSTSIGVEGVEHIAGEDLVVADTPDSFAAATTTLLNDPALQHSLAEAGRHRVESCYSSQRSVDRLQEALKIPLK